MTDPGSRDFEAAEAVAVGAFGEPGQRLFLLQVRGASGVVTVKVEKGQVAEMATHIVQAMADRPAVIDVTPQAAQLNEESEPAWAVGAIRLGYDRAADRVAIVLEEFQPAEEDAPEPSAVNVTISAEQAVALAGAITELVTAGRPPCPDCGYPLDPSGHTCPKSNGHRPPKL